MQMTCAGSDVKVRKEKKSLEELIKKLQDAGKKEALESEEALRTAAKELGYSDEQSDKMLAEVDIPLDASTLDKVAGGLPRPLPPTVDEAERGLI